MICGVINSAFLDGRCGAKEVNRHHVQFVSNERQSRGEDDDDGDDEDDDYSGGVGDDTYPEIVSGNDSGNNKNENLYSRGEDAEMLSADFLGEEIPSFKVGNNSRNAASAGEMLYRFICEKSAKYEISEKFIDEFYGGMHEHFRNIFLNCGDVPGVCSSVGYLKRTETGPSRFVISPLAVPPIFEISLNELRAESVGNRKNNWQKIIMV